MEIVYRIANLKSHIWTVESKAIIKTDGALIDLMTLNKFDYEIKNVTRCFYDGNFVFIIKSNEIVLIDSHLKIHKTVEFCNATGIRMFSENDYAIWYEDKNGEEYFDLYIDNIKVGTGSSFFGKIINLAYSYRFRNRKDRATFRLSNVLDTHTYFEYQCEFNEELTGEIIIYNEKIIFYTKEKDKELYETLLWINILDIKTGEKVHKVSVYHYGACFDYEKGLFISLQCTNQNNQIRKRFEVLDVNSGLLEENNLNLDLDMFAVGTAVQYFNDNKLYFVDNIYSYEEQKKMSPKIGCFDIETKQIIFLEELKEAEGCFINQIISIENLLFVITSKEELFALKI